MMLAAIANVGKTKESDSEEKQLLANMEKLPKSGTLRDNLAGLDAEEKSSTCAQEVKSSGGPADQSSSGLADGEKSHDKKQSPKNTQEETPGKTEVMEVSGKKARSKGRTTAFIAAKKSWEEKNTKPKTGEDSDSSSTSRTLGSCSDIDGLGERITSTRILLKVLNDVCTEKSISIKKQWGNELEFRMNKGDYISRYIIEVFLLGVTMERAHSVSEGFDQTTKLLAEHVSSLTRVIKNLNQSDSNLKASIKLADQGSKENQVLMRGIIDEGQRVMGVMAKGVGNLLAGEGSSGTVSKRESVKGIFKDVRGRSLSKEKKVYYDDPGSELEFDDMDDEALNFAIVKHLEIELSEEGGPYLMEVLDQQFSREEKIELLERTLSDQEREEICQELEREVKETMKIAQVKVNLARGPDTAIKAAHRELNLRQSKKGAGKKQYVKLY